jgi:hypothetical protein
VSLSCCWRERSFNAAFERHSFALLFAGARAALRIVVFALLLHIFLVALLLLLLRLRALLLHTPRALHTLCGLLQTVMIIQLLT